MRKNMNFALFHGQIDAIGRRHFSEGTTRVDREIQRTLTGIEVGVSILSFFIFPPT